MLAHLFGEPGQGARLDRGVSLEERVDDLPERDRGRLPERRRAVQDDEVDEPLALQLVDAWLAVRDLEREQRKRRRGREAETRGRLVDGSSPFEHGQQHLGTQSPLDIARSTRLDHVWNGDARRLGQGVLGLLVEPVAVVDRPRSTRSSGSRRGCDRRPRLHVVDLGRPAREDPSQGRPVCAHHAGRRQHLAIERPHARRIGNLTTENRPAACSVDRLVAERRVGEHAARRILDRDGAADDPCDCIRERKEVTERNARDAGGGARHHREAAQVEQRVELRPRHLLRHREDGDTEGAAPAHELVEVASPSPRRQPRRPAPQPRSAVAARRPEPDADSQHNRVARDRRELDRVVDHRLADEHVEPARRGGHLDHVATEILEQRLEIPRLVALPRLAHG